MFRWFFIFCSMLLLLGCSSKKEKLLMNSYTKKVTYNQNLKQTEKAKLYEDGNVKVLLTATYISTKQKSGSEKFIVNVIFDNPDENSISFKSNSLGYSLTLDGKSALSVKRLNKDDKSLKDISFITQWSKIYEVTFPHVKTKSFSLILTHPKYGSRKLFFSKVLKYTYKNELFLGHYSIF